jgi:N4-gp56 family major capsid protein
MAAHNWTFDADFGIYKNHAMSRDLLFVAVGATKILPFTQKVPDFGPNMGETINLVHVNELPDPANGGQLSEAVRIPIDKLSFGNRPITIVPWGRGVEYTDMLRDLGVFDISNITQKALTRQMERAMDTASARAFQDSTSVLICFTPTGATTGTFTTTGTPGAVASANLTFEHIGILADYMAGTVHIPPYQGEDYVGIGSRKLLRGLKSDTLWRQVYMYLQKGELFFKGELGMTENIRWVQTNREQAVSNTAGTSTVLGEGFIFGDEGVARAEVESPHLRADPNYQSDFGRVQAVAWYGKLAFASYWNVSDDGKAKIIRITSQ